MERMSFSKKIARVFDDNLKILKVQYATKNIRIIS